MSGCFGIAGGAVLLSLLVEIVELRVGTNHGHVERIETIGQRMLAIVTIDGEHRVGLDEIVYFVFDQLPFELILGVVDFHVVVYLSR